MLTVAGAERYGFFESAITVVGYGNALRKYQVETVR